MPVKRMEIIKLLFSLLNATNYFARNVLWRVTYQRIQHCLKGLVLSFPLFSVMSTSQVREERCHSGDANSPVQKKKT